MSHVWAVDQLSGLGRTLEAISLATCSLSNLRARVPELNKCCEMLPRNALRELREIAGGLVPIQQQLEELNIYLGEKVMTSLYICDPKVVHKFLFRSEEVIATPFCQFNLEHLINAISSLQMILAKSEGIAVAMNRQAHALVKAAYPSYQLPNHYTTETNVSGDDSETPILRLDISGESDELLELLQDLVIGTESDTCWIRDVISLIDSHGRCLAEQLPREAKEVTTA